MAHLTPHSALLAFFARHPAPPGATLLVAVSGGPDSLALLHALHALRGTLGLTLHVAHLDHTLRGAESAAEASFVAETARAWGIPCAVGAADVRALARGRNLADAARRARYAFLAETARAAGAYAVATAHHADDQAETVLAHLLRGAGPAGLSGMRPVTQIAGAAVLRPLLAVTHAALEDYCAANGLEPRRDPSNESTRATRTRIRRRLIPALIEYNPRIVEALCRTAEACAAEHALAEAQLDSAWPALAAGRSGALAFDGAAWAALPEALRGLAIRRAYDEIGGGDTLGGDDLARALAVAGGPAGKRAELPGGVWLTSGHGGGFRVSRGAPAEDGPQIEGAAELPAPGELDLGGGWRLRAELGAAQAPRDRWEVFLIPSAAPLRVRGRRPGDTLRPHGGRGARRLQDALLDARIPRALRDRWPLVVSGEIVAWGPGLRPAAGLVAAPGEPAIHLWITGHTTL